MPPPRSLAALLTVLALGAAATTGCGTERTAQESKTATGTATQAARAPADSGVNANGGAVLPIAKDTKKKPAIPKPEGTPPSQLVVRDIVPGTGPAAKDGDMLTVQYVGVSYSTGKQFDASWDNGQPFPFTLGAGNVIPGWDQGLKGLKRGGRRELVIPPALAYGAQGSPPVIKPGETLVFVIDLVSIG